MLTETLDGCESPGNNLPSTPQSVRTRPIKLPAAIVGGKKLVGGCPTLSSQFSLATVKQTVNFDQKQRFTHKYNVFGHFNQAQPSVDLSASQASMVDVALFFTSASAVALQNCINGVGPPVAGVSIDPTKSSMTVGTTVLTSGSLGGMNVAAGDFLSSGVLGGPNCTAGSAQATVQLNPAVPGTATLDLTALSFSGCSINMGLVVGTLAATVVVNNLPYSMSISDGAGDPATLGIVSLTISVMGGSSSCSYAAPAALTGGYANATDSLTFSGSALAFTGGTGSLATDCPTSSLSLPMLTSVVDSSVSGSPAVFVN